MATCAVWRLTKGLPSIQWFLSTRFHANGTMASTNQAAKISNGNALNKVPCSVAILVVRGLLNTSTFFLKNWSSYHVAVLFLGGADDRETLALGVRMAGTS